MPTMSTPPLLFLSSCAGGPLAITDANLVLGRLLPEHFPKIFGPNEDQPLDKKATLEAFDKLTEEVRVCTSVWDLCACAV